MKRNFLLFSLLVFSLLSNAQTKPTLGVRAGVISSSIEGDALKSLEGILDYTNGMITPASRKGFYAGLNVDLPLSSTLSIEPGVYYAQKGYELKGTLDVKAIDFLGANASSHLDMQYVDIPVLIKANISGLQIFAGPQLSYLMQSDLKSTAGLLGFNLLNNTTDATQQFNRWDAAITGGLGYKFANGFNITASYDHGLSKLDANKKLDSYNRSYKVGVGFNF